MPEAVTACLYLAHFILGWKAQSTAEGELGAWAVVAIFRKRRFLRLEWSVCACVFSARWTKFEGLGNSELNLVNWLASGPSQ